MNRCACLFIYSEIMPYLLQEKINVQPQIWGNNSENSSAAKRLIAYNNIQVYVCTLYIYVCINIHTSNIYFENTYMYLHVYIYIHIIYIIYKCLIYKQNIFFLKYIHVCVCMCMCMCIYIYIINIHSTHRYIMYTKTFILDAINRLTAQKKSLNVYHL